MIGIVLVKEITCGSCLPLAPAYALLWHKMVHEGLRQKLIIY